MSEINFLASFFHWTACVATVSSLFIVSLALIKEGKVIYHKTYGIRNLMTNASITESTLFEAASITKPVFAYTVHRLEEKGIIDLPNITSINCVKIRRL